MQIPPNTGARFPNTRISVIRTLTTGTTSEREHAMEQVARWYWPPVYSYLRLHWRVEADDARDLTQEFFARILAKDLLEKFDPSRSRFRTYVRLCLDSFLQNEWIALRRQKRGAGATHIPIDLVVSDSQETHEGLVAHADAEEAFHREWMRTLFHEALENFRKRCVELGKEIPYEVFHRYDVAGSDSERRPTYAELGRDLGLPITQVTNYLAWARRSYRNEILSALRGRCASDEEFRVEARLALGAEV